MYFAVSMSPGGSLRSQHEALGFRCVQQEKIGPFGAPSCRMSDLKDIFSGSRFLPTIFLENGQISVKSVRRAHPCRF
jgi:hypothetical protein